jgi:hypothetical protein
MVGLLGFARVHTDPPNQSCIRFRVCNKSPAFDVQKRQQQLCAANASHDAQHRVDPGSGAKSAEVENQPIRVTDVHVVLICCLVMPC